MHRATTSLPAPVSPVMRTFAVQRAARPMSWRSDTIVRLPPRSGTDASGAEGFTSIQHLPTVSGARRVGFRSESIDHLPPAVAHEFLTAGPDDAIRLAGVAALLQAEVDSDADVRNVFLKELAVGRWAFVQLEQDRDETSGVTSSRGALQFDPRASAQGLGPVVLLGRLQVDTTDQL